MSNVLTAEEEKLLDQYNKQRLKHNKVQTEYRKRLKRNDPNYNIKYNEYMRDYNAKRSKLIRNIKNKLMEQDQIPIIPEVEVLLEMAEPPKRRGRRRKEDMEIIPSRLIRQQRNQELKSSTMIDYLRKVNILQRRFKNKDLSPQATRELEKLFLDDPSANQGIILKEIDYINQIEDT